MINMKMIGKIGFLGGTVYVIYLLIEYTKLLDFNKTNDQITIATIILTGLFFMYRSIKYLFKKEDKK